MKLLLLLLILIGIFGTESFYAQITATGNTGTSTTAYTNGIANNTIYIWCAPGIGINQANLTATPASGTGPFTFKWYYHNQATFSWSLYTTTTGSTSTLTGLPSDGYRVEITDVGGVKVGCYVAWVWNMNTNISVASNVTSCNGTNLVGSLASESTYTYYNPPPPESIINSSTNINVCFQATHTYVSDLAFYLIGPPSCGSPIITLSPNPGANGQGAICNSSDNVNICFQKSSTNILNVCAPVATLAGTYGGYGPPANQTLINWSALNGCNAATAGWRVQIYDCIGGDVGALTNATITFSNLTSVCGSPTTITYNSGTINSAINDNSCTAATASIFEVQPAAISPITLTATTSYQWTGSPAITIPNSTTSLTPAVTNIPTGTTTFTLNATVSFGSTSCTYSESVNFINTCCTVVANAGPDINFCSGASWTIGTAAVPGHSYSWSPTTGLNNPSIAQPVVTLLNAGSTPQTTVYTLTVTNNVSGGCQAIDAVNVVVTPNLTPTFTQVAPICAGGTFTLPTTSTNSVPGAWSPAINTANTTTYTFTPTAGQCAVPTSMTVVVNPRVTPTFTQVPPICSGDALTALPTTSTNGIPGTWAPALNNTATTTYTFTPAAGQCANPATMTITVNTSPIPTINAVATLCSNSASVTLTATPAGGTFSGTGVSGNTFNPATAGAGSHTITYTTPAVGACPARTATRIITVTALPVATIAYVGPYCSSSTSAPVTQTGTTGGVYSSTGGLSIIATSGLINPSISTPGTYTVTYTIPAALGCPAVTATASVTITAIPVPTIAALATLCSNGASVPVTVAPAGGVLSGAGVTGNNFNPTTAGPGTHTLTYTIAAAAGCPAQTATRVVTVTALPAATIAYAGPYCSSSTSAPVTHTGTTGGVYSSTGGLSITATSGLINPSTSTPGTYTVTYTIPAGAGCPAVTATASVTITAIPVPTIAALATLCSNGTSVPVTVAPAGGVLSGTGVTGNNFNPTTAGPGTHTLTYTVAAAAGCPAQTVTRVVTVTALPTATIAYAGPYCSSSTSAPVTHTGTTGGVYSSTGGLSITATSGLINPSTSTPGTYTVTYTIPAALGCPAVTATASVTITAIPVPTIAALATLCSNGASVPVTVAPAGGVLSGAGVTGNNFNPTVAGPGTHTLTYTVAAAAGCPAQTATRVVTVTALPTATIAYVGPYCSSSTSAPVTQTGTTGGAYSSTGGLSIIATSGIINPSTSTPGTYTVTYTIPAALGCPAVTATASVTITAIPVPTIAALATLCSSGASVPVTVAPAGGVLSGAGVTGNNFNPTVAGPGTHTLTYTVAAAAGCPAQTATRVVTVTALPTATISYATPFCNTSTSEIVTRTGATGGVYSSTAGLTINPTTGLINPSTSTPGTYTVSYTIPAAAGCPAVVVTTTVDVNSIATATINYAASPYCTSLTTSQNVSHTGNTGGTYTSTAGLTINASTGAIIPSTSTPGTYTVTYTIAATVSCPAVVATATVTISQIPIATISYPTPFCSTSTSEIVTLTGNSGGVYSSTAGLTINATTGLINPSTSTAGTYTVTYTIAAGSGCPAVISTATITVTAIPVPVISPIAILCSNGGAVPVTVSPIGGILSGTGITGNNFNPTTAGAGTHTLTYTVAAAAGCPAQTTTRVVTVTALPTATISYPTPFCSTSTSEAVTLVGNTGGVYSSTAGLSINAITGTINPSTSTAGNYVVTYTIAAASGCPAVTATASVTVTAIPVPSITPLATLCSNGGAVPVTVSPLGGTLSGTGVTGNNFSPSVAGPGTHTLTYTIAAAAGCPSVNATSNVVVTALPTSTISYAGPFCSTSTSETVTQTGTTGGVFSGTAGLTINPTTGVINPSTSSTGTHTVTYTIAAALGCPAVIATAPIDINLIAVATIAYAGSPYCMNVTTPQNVTFTGSTGGTYSSSPAGLTLNPSTGSVTPSTSTAGTYTVTYTIPATVSCAAVIATATVVVNPLPIVSISPIANLCIDAVSVSVVTSPLGGTLAGPGITGTIFNPATAGAGTHTLTYDFTDGNGCSSSTTSTVVVNPLPTPSITPLSALCANSATVAITAIPTGGTFTGPGVSGTNFNPSTAGAGTHTITYNYTDANTCFASVTSSVIVNPVPTATILGTIDVCQNATAPVVTFTGAGGTAPYTFTYTLNGGANLTIVSTGNTATITVPTGTPLTNTYTLVSVQDASSTTCSNVQTGTVIVKVNALPTATIAGTMNVCQNGTQPTITFTGAAGVAPYTFVYTLNGVNQTLVSTGNTATINAPTTTAGTYTYALVSVQDASSTACVNPQTGNAIVIVNPLPTATIAGTIDVCQNATAPTITFTGANGTAPYTFVYTLNGVSQTVISAGNTATINAPTATAGTFTYSLVSVQDASSTTCLNPQVGTATVLVNPLPTATIAGTIDVCQNGTAPTITFTGANGTAPYTFNYILNGVNQTVVSTGNIATVTAPTGTAGTFTYALVSMTDASSTACLNPQTGTATVLVNPLPTATIAGTIDICQNSPASVITFTAANGTAPYTFVYTLNGVSQTVVSVGNSITVSAPTTTAGTFVYSLVSVQDASSTTCVNPQTGTATVIVNPLPTATIAGTVDVCQNGTAPTITFTGANGTAPYTFNYTLNGANQSVVSTGNNATVVAPTGTAGTFIYSLVSMQDGSSTTCTNFQTGTATILVNPLPTATISGTINVCQNGTAPVVTFTGANGTAPYTFVYTLNGVSQTVVSVTNSITVTAPTGTAGTFTYSLVSVQDASSTTCVNPQTGTATVIVNPLPTATIAGTIDVCQNATAPIVTFTGANGTAPYTFTYTLNGGANTTIISAGNSATITVPTGAALINTYTLVSVQDASSTTCSNVQTGTVIVKVNALPTATIAGTVDVCQNATQPTITFTGSTGVAPYTFTYNLNGAGNQTVVSVGNNATIPVPTTVAGNYVYTLVSVQDASSTACVNLQAGSATVVVKPLPVVTATPSLQTICSGANTSVALSSAPANATYSWTVVSNALTGATPGTGNSISQTLSATSTAVGNATYTITPTLAGCAGLPTDVIITVNPLPTVVATPASQAICSESATAIVLSSAPTGSMFTWVASATNVTGSTNGSGSNINQTLSSTSVGTVTYAVTPTLNGCVGPVTNVIITVNPKPILLANPTSPSICAGSSVTLNVSGASTYVWSPTVGLSATTGSSVDANPAYTQAYVITGTDVNGCINTTNANVTVNPMPITTVTPDGAICIGNSMSLTASGANSYTWSPTTGLNSATGNTVVANPITTTTYTVTGTSLNCSTTATVTVTVNPLPVVNAGLDQTICAGVPVILTGAGAVSYAWNNGVTNNVPFSPIATTTYTVTGTSAFGCIATDEVIVTVTDRPIIAVIPSAIVGCLPVNVTFANTTTGAVSYLWDFGDGKTSTDANPSHTYLTTGCFDVTLTAYTADGCATTQVYQEMICTYLAPIASFIANPTTITTATPFSNMINTSLNSNIYEWDFGDGSGISNVKNPAHTFPDDEITTYVVTLVASNESGCTDTARVTITIIEDIVYYVPNVFTPDGDIFNQTFQPVFTSGFDPYDYSMYIYNRWGELIFESHDALQGWDGSYLSGSGEMVQEGSYVWVIEFKNKQDGKRQKITGHVSLIR